MTQRQAAAIARQVLAGLKSGEAAPAIDNVASLTASNQLSLEHPSTQTTILMGQIGMSRHDPDYFSLYVGNHILGGSGLVSMLSDEVREKRGLTYGVYSYFRPMMMQGPYVFSLKTRNDQKQEALQVMRDTLIGFVENGPTVEQVEAAKRNITGGFALRVDSNSEIASYLAMIGFYNLPLDYLDTFNDKVNQVTAEQIKQAFERRVHPDKMLTVMVGGKE
jgi:zinc protease